MMQINNITTLGELKETGYQSKSIKNELRDNLISAIKAKKNSFTGIHGYETTVIPQLEQAILAKHNINLLGLRGQAKTKIARQLIELLDEYVPVVEGSEINDDPFNPISSYAKNQLKEKGDETPITWLHRSKRFAEKLATPDVTVADLIGDIDPIKASNLKLSYADERVIHYGMIPRANRCIFVINELPDLQARIQVALFNILQEGDIQIRGFNLRLQLDLEFVFTANPEDYTNRGSIVTPLKDRIGSQILTHYPNDINISKTITKQEAQLTDFQKEHIHIPEFAHSLLEQIAVEARDNEYIDAKSGVSARLSISAFENLVSTAERRMLLAGDQETQIRMSDFIGIIPAITGKIELMYEGEELGAEQVTLQLLENAIKSCYNATFPEIKKLTKKDEDQAHDSIINWFLEHEIDFIVDDNNQEYISNLKKIKPSIEFVQKHLNQVEDTELYFYTDFIIWALAAFNKIDRITIDNKINFKDSFSNYINDL